jgi:hypothetical protein
LRTPIGSALVAARHSARGAPSTPARTPLVGWPTCSLAAQDRTDEAITLPRACANTGDQAAVRPLADLLVDRSTSHQEHQPRTFPESTVI